MSVQDSQQVKKSAIDLGKFEATVILTDNKYELGKGIGAALFFVQVAYILVVIPIGSTFGTKARK